MNELTIELKAESKIPLYEQIYVFIKENIQSGRIVYREKLPSTRALAKHLEVSRSTVELAYANFQRIRIQVQGAVFLIVDTFLLIH
mgnify:CR=1 FL=1